MGYPHLSSILSEDGEGLALFRHAADYGTAHF